MFTPPLCVLSGVVIFNVFPVGPYVSLGVRQTIGMVRVGNASKFPLACAPLSLRERVSGLALADTASSVFLESPTVQVLPSATLGAMWPVFGT